MKAKKSIFEWVLALTAFMIYATEKSLGKIIKPKAGREPESFRTVMPDQNPRPIKNRENIRPKIYGQIPNIKKP